MAPALLRKLRAFVRCLVVALQDSDSDDDAQLVSQGFTPAPPPPPLPLPDSDDILLEILLRLPPLPSSLPRASLVCKRWRRLLSEPDFRRRFRARHGAPPLLGFFTCVSDSSETTAADYLFRSSLEPHDCVAGRPGFLPTLLDPPDRVPRSRFSPPPEPASGRRDESWTWRPLGSRHGLALFLDVWRHEAIVWDPVARSQRSVPCPPELMTSSRNDAYNGGVLLSRSAARDDDDCSLSSFRLVLVCCEKRVRRILVRACIYDCESGNWGEISSAVAAVPSSCLPLPGVLVGDSLHWGLRGSDCHAILEFDTVSLRLAVRVISIPSGVIIAAGVSDVQVLRLRTHDGRGQLGLAVLSEEGIHVWERTKVLDDGDVGWEEQRFVHMDYLLPLKPPKHASIMGYREDTNEILLAATGVGAFMIQLDTMHVRKISSDHPSTLCYPYASFFFTAVGDMVTMELK